MKNGFTIIELVISIFILSVAVVGIFSAFSVMVILTSDAANQFTATYLAQEGMEIARNIRDTNWLYMNICASGVTPLPSNVTCPASWVDGLNCGSGCEADYTTTGSVSNPVKIHTGDYLNIDADGFYSYSTTGTVTPTIFKRKIIIKPIADVNNQPDDHIIKVIVQVSWDKKATILSSGVSAENCCPDPANSNCPANVSNCVITEETLYDWYNYSGQ